MLWQCHPQVLLWPVGMTGRWKVLLRREVAGTGQMATETMLGMGGRLPMVTQTLGDSDLLVTGDLQSVTHCETQRSPYHEERRLLDTV